MNWEIGTAIADIIGAIAVVISLIYLALQIREQTNQSRLAAQHEVSGGIREVSNLFATEDISDIFVRANNNFDSMADAERVRLIVASTNFFMFGKRHLQSQMKAIQNERNGSLCRGITLS